MIYTAEKSLVDSDRDSAALVEQKIKNFKSTYNKKYNDKLEEIMQVFKQAAKSFYPSSKVMENLCRESINLLLDEKQEERQGEWVLPSDLFIHDYFNDDYTMFELNGDKEKLGTALETAAISSLVFEQGVQMDFESLYSNETDSEFNFLGKKIIRDIMLADKASYFSFSEELSNTIFIVQELEAKVAEISGYKSNGENTLVVAILELDEADEKIKKLGEDRDASIFDAAKQETIYPILYNTQEEEGAYLNGINRYVQELSAGKLNGFEGSLLYNIGEMKDEVVRLGEVHTMMNDYNDVVSAVRIHADDLAYDIKVLVEELSAVEFASTKMTMAQIVDITKRNYIKSGELDLSLFEDQGFRNNVFSEDCKFMENAEQRAFIDITFDMGVLPDGIDRSMVNIENIDQFLSLENVDQGQMFAYLEKLGGHSDEELELVKQITSYASGIFAKQAEQGIISEDQLYLVNREFAMVGSTAEMIKNCKFQEYIVNIEYSTLTVTLIGKREEVGLSEDFQQEGVFAYFESNRDYRKQKEEMNRGLLLNNIDAEIDEISRRINKYGVDVTMLVLQNQGVDVATLIAKKVGREALAKMLGVPLSLAIEIYDLVVLMQELEKDREELAKLIDEKDVVENNDAYDTAGEYDDAGQLDFSMGVIFNEIGGQYVEIAVSDPLSTISSAKTMYSINDAAIFSQGKGTEGEEEAMQASYETAVANGASILDEEYWKSQYAYSMSSYNEQLQDMREMSLTELVERYEECKQIFELIDSILNII
ncbi:MAG: hypothetical protein ACK5LZ_02110 [Anaerorhabdus sp.]